MAHLSGAGRNHRLRHAHRVASLVSHLSRARRSGHQSLLLPSASGLAVAAAAGRDARRIARARSPRGPRNGDDRVTTANCPGCGASVEFAIGSSAVVVCKYCRALVARTDRGVENDGKVAALIDTGSPLHVGVAGKYRGIGFRITGRTQMKHQAGGVWDEW